jgi:hypothetical protein
MLLNVQINVLQKKLSKKNNFKTFLWVTLLYTGETPKTNF